MTGGRTLNATRVTGWPGGTRPAQLDKEDAKEMTRESAYDMASRAYNPESARSPR